MTAPMLMHATCVAIDGRGVLIAGPSGSGKSDLALRLIDRGAVLVSDDQVILTSEGGVLRAAAPATIAGKIEVRSLGIAAMEHLDDVPVVLFIQLQSHTERMPLAPQTCSVAGIDLPMIALDPFESSAPIKAELAMRELAR